MPFELLFVALFSVATGVALVARWLRTPYTVALVVAGVLLGSVRVLDAPHLTKDLLYAVFLPGLLFEAAFHLEFRKFWQNKVAIHALAVPGLGAAVVLTTLFLTPVADALHFVEGFTFVHGAVFAALIAATDPIAVVALFKSLGAPKRLAILVEGESLLNDGTAVVLFTLILAAATGSSTSAGWAALDFARVVGGGVLIGTAISFAASKVIQQVDEPVIEITLTSIAAYGSFALAEQFHFSGVIATVTAGMICGNYATHTGMSPATRIAVESFWEYVAFALNSIVFLLIGFEVRLTELVASYKAILVAFAAVTLARAVVIFAVTALLKKTKEKISWSWATVLTWGGLRGGLSMVLALALPSSFPHRGLLVTMTFGVVVLSILLQGLTMAPLLRKLGVVGARTDRVTYERGLGQLRACKAALEALGKIRSQGIAPASVVEVLEREYRDATRRAESRLHELQRDLEQVAEEETLAVRRQLLVVEKDTLLDGIKRGQLGAEAGHELLRDVDARLLQLDAQDHATEVPSQG